MGITRSRAAAQCARSCGGTSTATATAAAAVAAAAATAAAATAARAAAARATAWPRRGGDVSRPEQRALAQQLLRLARLQRRLLALADDDDADGAAAQHRAAAKQRGTAHRRGAARRRGAAGTARRAACRGAARGRDAEERVDAPR